MTLPITAGLAAFFSILLIPLTLQVGLKRISTGIFFGDGGDMGLAQRRAAHSNFLDHVPLFLLTLALCEMNAAPAALLVAMAGSMLPGRLAHLYCMLFTNGIGNSRAAGMILTFIAHLAGGGYLAFRVLTVQGVL